MDEIPSQELYTVLGEFNAQVGARNCIDQDQWQRSRSPHGIGEANNAGKELLSFLCLNEATTCNTWFQRKEIYKGTWQHPTTKGWHCIDYAIMRATDRRRFLDISVKRGAECNIDHRLLRMKLRKFKLHQIVKTTPSPQRFDVSKLSGPSLDKDGENTSRRQFQELANKIAKEQWKVDGSIENKWATVGSALTKAAKAALGVQKRRHPDWFRESASSLEPILQKKNLLLDYLKRLRTGRSEDKQKWAWARSEARRTVRSAKNTWFTNKANEAEQSRFGGKEVWKCIRDMQYGRRACMDLYRQDYLP